MNHMEGKQVYPGIKTVMPFSLVADDSSSRHLVLAIDYLYMSCHIVGPSKYISLEHLNCLLNTHIQTHTSYTYMASLLKIKCAAWSFL